MLEISSLDVRYGEALALRSVSLTVEAGSTVALIGSNGAGKSTLVRAIMGMLPISDGRILLDGVDVTAASASARPALGMSLAPEARRLFPDLSVLDNLKIGLYDPSAQRRSAGGLEWVMELFPILRERAKQRAGTLSGGEQQMVALGRALISRPRILVLDEPSLGLAPVIVEKMFEVLHKVRADGVTILIAEQNMTAALQMSDVGYVLDDGKITISGPAQDLLKMPAVRAAYLGEV